MKFILVIGGTGFIGSNLCYHLVADSNNNVFCLDNNSTGKLSNIKDLYDKVNFKFIFHDIQQPININNSIDEIYYLACPASPPKYQKNPLYTLNTCFNGTINVL